MGLFFAHTWVDLVTMRDDLALYCLCGSVLMRAAQEGFSMREALWLKVKWDTN